MFVGPVPPRRFLDKLEVEPKRLKGMTRHVDFADVPTKSSKEAAMYKPLVDAFNECCPGFKFYVAAQDKNGRRSLRPDIGMVEESHMPEKAASQVRAEEARRNSNRSRSAQATVSASNPFVVAAEEPADTTNTYAYDWAYSELACEVKASASADAFDDNNINTVDSRLTPEGRSNRGQLISYYKEQASRQQRTHIFQLFIFGSWARFLRFDRSGCLVSARFDYKKNPRLLVEFLYRYSLLDNDARGWDTSRVLASSDQARDYDQEITKFLKGERPAKHPAPNPSSPLPSRRSKSLKGNERVFSETLRASVAESTRKRKPTRGQQQVWDAGDQQDGQYPAYTMEVTFKGSSEATTLIFRKPIHEPYSPFGRATRGYLSYDKTHDEILFLKDYWRPNFQEHLSEAEVFDILVEHDVRHLPKVLAAGDVIVQGHRKQQTVTDTFPQDASNEKWRKSCGELRSHVHHYIVQELLYPLSSFKTSQELILVLMDAIEAIEDARKDAKILHRDISVANIMISPDGHGVLNDWDNSGPTPGTNPKRKIAPFRTGTWQFMSIALLKDTEALHELWHDMESVSVWCLLYMALHHLPHKYETTTGVFPMYIFDHVDDIQAHPDGKTPLAEGGTHKKEFLTSQRFEVLKFKSAPLQDLLQDVFQEFADFYVARDRKNRSAEDRERYLELLDKLNNPMHIHAKFKRAYERKDWPKKSDRLPDQYPPRTTEKKIECLQQAIADSITRNDPVQGSAQSGPSEGARKGDNPAARINRNNRSRNKDSRKSTKTTSKVGAETSLPKTRNAKPPKACGRPTRVRGNASNRDTVARGPDACRSSSASRKRAAEDDGDDPATDSRGSGIPLRRSKRLRK